MGGHSEEVFEDKNIHEDELAVILSELENHLTVTDIILDVYSNLFVGWRERGYRYMCA